jgi:hypothetical protein
MGLAYEGEPRRAVGSLSTSMNGSMCMRNKASVLWIEGRMKRERRHLS